MPLSIDRALKVLNIEDLTQLSIVEAKELAKQYHPLFPPHAPALILNVAALELKTILLTVYPPTHRVQLISGIGTKDESITTLILSDLAINRLTDCLYLPALNENTSFEEFQELIAHLRAPDGCPWDREQTHLSLRRNLIEETYEVLEALDAEDPKAIQEELGDLLVQVMLHTQIASEAGKFRMADVLNAIITKLVARHPHVFGDLKLRDADAVIANWEHLKSDERKTKGIERGVLDGVTAALPALSQAETYQARVARVGFEWREIGGVIDKVKEEVDELKEAKDAAEREAEYGDLLFALVNLARWLKLDPEAALRAANARFKLRFAYVEAGAKRQGRELKQMTLEEMDALWEEGKKQIKLQS